MIKYTDILMDTGIFDAVFWSFFITSVIAFLLKMTSMAYQSKCKEVSCCCLKIVRDTEAEEREDEIRFAQQTTMRDTQEETKIHVKIALIHLVKVLQILLHSIYNQQQTFYPHKNNKHL